MKLRHNTLENFIKNVRGKKNVICFGAGAALTRFLFDYPEIHLEDEIKCIVDNSKDKQGNIIYCRKKNISIISPTQMLNVILSNDIILVTTIRFNEVLEQLESYDKLENIKCFFYYFLLRAQDDYERKLCKIPSYFTSKGSIHIPKIIHYCWFGDKQIPKQNRIWMESWKKFCPDYQIIEWNESNYDVSKNLYMRQAYEKRKWAFVSDYARLDIIEQYGGVYLDTDVELLKNIDILLKNEAFCGFENKKYVAFGLGFGAVKNHELINELKNDYKGRPFVFKSGETNETPCPIYQTELLEKYNLKRNGQFQILKNITIYPVQVLCAMSPYSFKVMNNLENSYSIHHYTGSWSEKKFDSLYSKY